MSPFTMTRRNLLAASATLAAAGPLTPTVRAAEVEPRIADGKAWYDVTQWGVEGRGWTDEPRERWFDRLPAAAEGKVREPVWNLSRHSAGMSVRFATDASAISVNYDLLSGGLGMPHMPATGVSGVDLYAKDSAGQWRWAGVVKPTRQKMTATIVSGIEPGTREYMLYLPLYNGVNALEVGVPKNANFKPIAPRADKPIVFYGTSIMHGACASRPGMSITGILGRRLDRPTINVAFSGNGKMEKEVGDFLVRLDPAIYAIDCCPNMNAGQITARTAPLVHQLRAARPDVPIVLVEDRRNANSWLTPGRRSHHDANHQALRREYEKLIDAGVPKLHYLGGDNLIGDDFDGTTDGSHPNDLGMYRYADAYEPVLRSALTSA